MTTNPSRATSRVQMGTPARTAAASNHHHKLAAAATVCPPCKKCKVPADHSHRGPRGGPALEARGGRTQQEGLDICSGDVLMAPAAIKYNPSNDEFYARCGIAAHGRCIITRSAHWRARPCQGRPLGLSAAWVLQGEQYETRENHMRCRPSLVSRVQARRDLSHAQNAHEFFACERARRSGEGSEPETAPWKVIRRWVRQALAPSRHMDCEQQVPHAGMTREVCKQVMAHDYHASCAPGLENKPSRRIYM